MYYLFMNNHLAPHGVNAPVQYGNGVKAY